jgi:hypothetical protein
MIVLTRGQNWRRKTSCQDRRHKLSARRRVQRLQL